MSTNTTTACYWWLVNSLSPPVCLPEDPLLADVLTSETEARERSVLGPARKQFFSPRTFGEGESGELSACNLTTPD